MKGLFIILFLFSTLMCFAQKPPYPTPFQKQGSLNTAQQNPGGEFAMETFVPPVYFDTTEANLGRAGLYPGSEIFTTDSSFYWGRNKFASQWNKIGTGTNGGSGNDSIYVRLPIRKQGIDTITVDTVNAIQAGVLTPLQYDTAKWNISNHDLTVNGSYSLNGNNNDALWTGYHELDIGAQIGYIRLDTSIKFQGGVNNYQSAGDSALAIGTNGVLKKYSLGGAGSGWLLTGNSGTNPSTNFIGTTDNQNIVFKRNNIFAGLLSAGTQLNTSFGVNALNSTLTGRRNTAFGSVAMNSLTTGTDNIAIGFDAALQLSSGNNNTSIGNQTNQAIITGSNNVAVGNGANLSNNETQGNTCIGVSTLQTGGMSTTTYNTAIGYLAGSGTDVADSNTYIGAFSNITTGFTNSTAVGANALVEQSNSMVLGSIAGINGATFSTDIGIGTTTPAARLEINESSNIAFIVSRTTGDGNMLLIDPQNALYGIGDLNNYANGNNLLINDNTGIITYTANGSHQFVGNVDVTGSILMHGAFNLRNSFDDDAFIFSTNGDFTIGDGVGDFTNTYIDGSQSGSQITINASNGILLNQGGGNVGIGTSMPPYKLSVAGGRMFVTNGLDGLYLTENEITAGEQGLYSNNSDQPIAVFNSGSNSYTYASGGLTYLKNTNFFGVNNASPVATLDVIGDIKGSNLTNGLVQSVSGVLENTTYTAPQIVKSNCLSGQTSPQTILAYTTGGADSSFTVSAQTTITALSVNVVNTTVTYTDETNLSRTLTFFPMGATSATLSIGASNYAVMGEIRVKASTTITVAVTATGIGTETYNSCATITKIH